MADLNPFNVLASAMGRANNGNRVQTVRGQGKPVMPQSTIDANVRTSLADYKRKTKGVTPAMLAAYEASLRKRYAAAQ